MQRIACITQRPPLLSFSAGIRYNSTEVPSPTRTVKRAVRVPVARLGDVVIPSLEEVRAKRSKLSYAADISYLDNASSNFLSAKLAQLERKETAEEETQKENPPTELPSNPTSTVKRTARVPIARLGDVVIPSIEEIQAKAESLKPSYVSNNVPSSKLERLGRQETVEEETPKEPSYAADISYLDNASNKFLSAKIARSGHQKTIETRTLRPTPTPVDIAALTAQRREDRKNRAADGARQHLLDYVPVPEKSDFLRTEFAKSNVFLSPERSQPRRVENLYRRSPQVRPVARGLKGQSSQPNERQPIEQSKRRAPVVAQATQNVTALQIEDYIDEAVFQAGHEPEFNGPELLSSNLLEHFGPSFGAKNPTVVAQSGIAIQIPISKIDSFHKGNYSRYVYASKEDYTSPPDLLGVVKVAERTLSHQSHYNLTARDRTLELVAQASQSSKPKAELANRR